MITTENLTQGLLRAHEHWNASHTGELQSGAESGFTIALSRQCGTYGAAIAREVGNRLGWPVYDSELLQHIADDLKVHSTLLESVDERQENWLCDCLEGFFTTPKVSSAAYFRRLIETLMSLASHGNCIVVGRGATQALPRAKTLRVRVIAPMEHRIEAVARERNISRKEAAARVELVDRERNRFVSSHFGSEPTDPANYDLVLNAARLSTVECADLILAALNCLRNKTAFAVGTEVAV